MMNQRLYLHFPISVGLLWNFLSCLSWIFPRTHFGLVDPVSDAEDKIDNLKMHENQHIVNYTVEFNCLAVQTTWNDSVLHRYYCGLAECIKDTLGQQGKPSTLSGMKNLAYSINAHYWEHHHEKSHPKKVSAPDTDLSSSKTSLSDSDDNPPSNSENSRPKNPDSEVSGSDSESDNSNSDNSDPKISEFDDPVSKDSGSKDSE